MKAPDTTTGLRRSRLRPAGARDHVPDAPTYVLVAFIVLTFGNLASRYEFIGVMRPTVIFILLLLVMTAAYWRQISTRMSGSSTRWLGLLIGYILLSLPLVEWPGSVIDKNFEVLLKGVVFYFFTVLFVDNPRRLSIVVAAFVASQTFRVIEPLWMHFTQGYWGSDTFIGGESMMSRLSGSPADSINPNGLAFVIVTVLPFVHFWAVDRKTFFSKIVYAAMAGVLITALVLSSSRSGMLALAIEIVGIIFLSKRRVMMLSLVAAAVVVITPTLSQQQLERYQSLYRSDVSGAGTAHGRIEGIETDFIVFREHPLFGHGLGTSLEANFNATGGTHYSHNLYTESLIELGAVGSIFVIGYLVAIWRQSTRALRLSRALQGGPQELPAILRWLPLAVFVWVFMTMIFNLASYGLSEYHWYFFGGLAVVLTRLLSAYEMPAAETTPVANVRRRRR